MPDEPRLEEQALSGAAEMTLATQLDEVENISVDVRTTLLKMVQGQVDSVSIVGQGLVIQEDLRVQEMELHTDSIAINPLSAILGQIELNQPVDATARIVLTQEDINRALDSGYIRNKFQSLELNVEGQIVTLEPQQLKIQLPGSNRIRCRGTILLHEMGKTQSVGITIVFRLLSLSESPLLEAFNCTPGVGMSLEVAIALMKKVSEFLNLPYFELGEMALRLKALDVQAGSLTLHTEAYVRQLPDLSEK
jgi:hypothetical protein